MLWIWGLIWRFVQLFRSQANPKKPNNFKYIFYIFDSCQLCKSLVKKWIYIINLISLPSLRYSCLLLQLIYHVEYFIFICSLKYNGKMSSPHCSNGILMEIFSTYCLETWSAGLPLSLWVKLFCDQLCCIYISFFSVIMIFLYTSLWHPQYIAKCPKPMPNIATFEWRTRFHVMQV